MAARRKAPSTAAPISADDFEPDAYCIRSCDKDGGSHNGYRWPLDIGAIAICPDWEPTPECGHGLHGILDGIGDWSLIDDGADRLWQIIGVLRAEVVPIDDQKVKFPRGKVVYVGSAAGAMAWIQPRMVEAILARAVGNAATGDGRHAAATGYRGHAAATGNRGHAAATGNSGHAAATGYSGHAAATGDSGHAAATGDRGHAAATGYSGHAAATGYRGHAAATGKHAIAVSLGYGGTAMAGPDGWIVLALWNEECELLTVRTAKVGGPEGIKPDRRYRLGKDGEFGAVEDAA